MNLEDLLAPHRAGLDARAAALVRRPVRYHPATTTLPAVGAARLAAMLGLQLGAGGKRLRALLPPALVAAADGPVEAARDLGACIELVHNGTLVHDDIQDGDQLRRGQPTLWTQVGVAQAINAGDALLVAPIAALLQAPSIPPGLRAPLAALLAEAVAETIRGQVADLALRDDPAPTLATVTAIDVAKTAPLFSCCCAGAALLLDLDAQRVAAAHDLGIQIGLAFQIRDDLLDLLGTKGRGQPGADLREGKPTWAVLLACADAPPDEVAQLHGLLGRARAGEPLEPREIASWIRWLHEHEAAQRTRAELEAALASAHAMAAAAFPPAAAAVVAALCDRLRAADA